MNAFIASLVRHALTFVGGALVTKGVVDAATSGLIVDQLTAQLTPIAVGAASSGLALAWSWIEKRLAAAPAA